ncbi:MAG: cyclic lactone autoinducer peptide [Clostridiales bacterium]|nr:cyclic lactone autoinducer peptide [Clostridiales bacterium]
MKIKLMGLVSVLATLAAVVLSSSACWFYMYQPEEPASLRDR